MHAVFTLVDQHINHVPCAELLRRMGRARYNVFPWSDSEDSTADSARPSPVRVTRSPRPAKGPSQNIQEHSNLDIRVVAEDTTAGKILRHCIDVVRAIQQENGGSTLCVFKIGLTANPLQRRESYRLQNFKSFVIIHQTYRPDLLGMMEMLEAAVIAAFYDDGYNCRNRQLGGESMRDRSQVPRFPPPYYAYCAATNASQKEPILG